MERRLHLNSERSSWITEEDIEGNRVNQSILNKSIFDEISKLLSHDEWKPFGRHLGLATNDLEDLEQYIFKDGRQYTINRMLEKWKQKENPDEAQLVPPLVKSLMAIERNDIVHAIQQKYNYRNHHLVLDLPDEMKSKLKKRFRNLELPTFLWLTKKRYPLDDLFVELTMRRKNVWGKEEDRIIAKEELFVEKEVEIPRRILIEGHPGYGKTTLVAKLLSDWSKGQEYMSERFDLVFLILLRNYKGNLSHHLLQQCAAVKGSDEEKLKTIKAVQHRVLLLLDGLDETETGVKDKLVPLISGEEYRNMTVVVTCRTGFDQIENKSNESGARMSTIDCEERFIWDRRVQIKGILSEKRVEFLQKYLNVDEDQLKVKVFQTSFELSDFYECPLFLLLLAVLIQEKDCFSLIRTRTELYKTIFNCVINRGLEKLYGQIKEFDVFDMKSDFDDFGCRHLLFNFGRLCLEKLKTRSLMFEERELLSCSDSNGDNDLILKLGFLSKQISFFNYEEREYYEPIHKSFIEFSSAFFLSSVDEIVFKSEIRELVLYCNIWPRKDQLLYPFLGGFLHSNAFRLFNALYPYRSLISVFSDMFVFCYDVENVLPEIPQTEEILESLENLSAENWETVKYKEFLHEWFVVLLKNVTYRSEDTELEIPEKLDILNCVSGDIEVNTIRLNIGKDQVGIKGRNVQCRNLTIDIFGIYGETPLILKDVMNKIKAEKIWMTISPSTDKDFIRFLKALNGEEFRYFKLYYLTLKHIPPSLFSSASPFIRDLIKSRKIECGVDIKFSMGKINNAFRKKFKSFVKHVSNSHIKSIGINYQYNYLSPFPFVFYNIEKQKEFLDVSGLFKVTKMEKVKSLSVEHFNCMHLITEEKGFLPKLLLKIKNIKRLSCDSNLISDLGACDYISEWKGFQTIDRLDLWMNYMKPDEAFLKGISWFVNVREVHFICLPDSEFLIKIISCFPPLKKICFSSHEMFLAEFLQRFLVLKDEVAGRDLCFYELHFKWIRNLYFGVSSMELIKLLEMCILEHVFHSFFILHEKGFDLKVLLKYFISKEEFNVSSQLVKDHCRNVLFGINDALLSIETPLLNTVYSISLRNV